MLSLQQIIQCIIYKKSLAKHHLKYMLPSKYRPQCQRLQPGTTRRCIDHCQTTYQANSWLRFFRVASCISLTSSHVAQTHRSILVLYIYIYIYMGGPSTTWTSRLRLRRQSTAAFRVDLLSVSENLPQLLDTIKPSHTGSMHVHKFCCLHASWSILNLSFQYYTEYTTFICMYLHVANSQAAAAGTCKHTTSYLQR